MVNMQALERVLDVQQGQRVQMSLGRAGYGSGRSVCKYSGAEREGSRSSTNVSSPNARRECWEESSSDSSISLSATGNCLVYRPRLAAWEPGNPATGMLPALKDCLLRRECIFRELEGASAFI